MEFAGFTTMDFDPRSGPGFVYVLFWVGADNKETPFYVGETQSALGRLNDYYWAGFKASTDFNIGEAVKHLWARNCRVVAKYRPSTNQKQDEKGLIAGLRAEGYTLLNRQLGYDYKKMTEEKQRLKVQAFVDNLIASRKTARSVSN
jgi:hypothetical protein